MKSAVRTAIAALMLLGLFSAAAMPKTPTQNTVAVANSGPPPLCYPKDPGCKPPIPTN